MRKAIIRAIDYYLPEQCVTNEDLVKEFPTWTAEKIEAKTGIRVRRIAGAKELPSDMAVNAARKLFDREVCRPADIDFVLLCTQSPDYLLPTSACLVQNSLGIPVSAGALDFNLGCSGFVYGLAIAKGLIETAQAENVLLLTAETYSKHMAPTDIGVRAVFGDGAAATLLTFRDETSDVRESQEDWLGPFVFGTDGQGSSRLILRRGSLREACCASDKANEPLYMNGPDIYAFTLKAVPQSVQLLLQKTGFTDADIDLYVFHQANQYMLENLRKKIGIAPEKFVYALDDCGNTVSSTIPIALRRAAEQKQLLQGQRVMLVGFGVGYSWTACLLRWGDWAI